MLDLDIIIKAIVLGLLEGGTEFIPVSSTAHLLVASKLINFSDIQSGVFEIVIQLGAILAVCLLYLRKIFKVVVTFPSQPVSRNFVFNILLAFLPAALLGAIFHDLIKSLFFSSKVIGLALMLGGIVIILVEKLKPLASCYQIEEVGKARSFYIGLFQSLAMIPGVSRSGATIIGGLLLKLDRKIATEFSFFLSIPTICGAVFYDLYKNYHTLTGVDWQLIAIGFISAFMSSLLVIKWLIKFVSHNNFIPFACYRIIIGLLILFYLV